MSDEDDLEAGDDTDGNEVVEEIEADQKALVLLNLFAKFQKGAFEDGIVKNNDIVDAIQETSAGISQHNPANFLKDLIRSDKINSRWPTTLCDAKITARQRYGKKRVFQFKPYEPGQTLPFPDNFEPRSETPTYAVQSASIPFLARKLGRREETWLTQVIVNLKIIETHFSLFSSLQGKLRDVTHLQMGRKTQPEIDAVFLVTLCDDPKRAPDTFRNAIVSCEAKQGNQRILEDQVREQVAKIFQTSTPDIQSVIPFVVRVHAASKRKKIIHAVELKEISRTVFDAKYQNTDDDEERLYKMPLEYETGCFFELMPPVPGINAPVPQIRKPKS